MPVKRTPEEAREYMREYRARRRANGGRPLGVKGRRHITVKRRIAATMHLLANRLEGR